MAQLTRPNVIFIGALVAIAALSLAAIAFLIQTDRPQAPAPTTLPIPIPAPEPVELLAIEQFENNEQDLNQAGPAQLERLLQDLNGRKDWDLSCNDNQPGPDNAYLVDWCRKVSDALTRQGYTSRGQNDHNEPNLYRPNGTLVPRRHTGA